MTKNINFIKKVEIKIECENDNFVLERPEDEIRSILQKEVDRMEHNNIDSRKLYDTNGNVVGHITVTR